MVEDVCERNDRTKRRHIGTVTKWEGCDVRRRRRYWNGWEGRWRYDEVLRIGTNKSRYIYLIANGWGWGMTIADDGY